ncbi:nucleotidyl transferase AbiEii/AbiGii toxin family protein [Prosthecobacter sp.]|uniref:nucleotidyl transferase AbiEii/AbiGii toxin family protein n=1 Tax=Prosthecobacter sp. TaxID=1965333 RepID=UPI002AB8A0BB|nr:nucleotidyl transferase AbiEii/AbiGii toxin family protein [Prosthecobacter sp.]MDZ4406011.1 nucleotidyl transferase AbiEii/AbiGii toxin family protein [Prosthecobacter sp.]
MSLFDQLVNEALKSRADLATLRPVVEKELLHHDILREMSEAGLLAGLTFMGGTCLRACYGSARLSEDLDFTGGSDFKKADLAGLARVLTERLQTRYGLPVSVSEPVKTSGKVSTWKLTVETRPGQKHLPAQRIHLDICAIPSHDPRPQMLRNLYGVDLGTSGLILQAQSREEILADKIIALAFRENRVKNRDLWDIVWLVQQGVELPAKLIPLKVRDHQRTEAEFVSLLRERVNGLKTLPEMLADFVKEMRRFLPAAMVRDTIDKEAYWTFLTQVIGEQSACALASL